MLKKKMVALIANITVVAMVLAGCGSSNSSSKYSDYDTGAAYDSYAATSEEAYYSDDLYEYAEEVEAPMVMKEAETADSNESLEKSSASNRKLIKNVNMSVQTKEFDKLIDTLTKRIDALGGYAEEMNVNGYSYDASSTSTRSAYITARIPQQNLNSFVTTITENSNIISKNESTNDVTLEYSDVEARRNSLRIEQERLNELLKQAESVDVIIELENRLTDVRYELESYESRLRNIDNKVDYSTVYLDIQEVKDYTPVVTPEKSFGQRIAEGFLSGCVDAVDGFQDFVVALFSILPGFIAFLIVLAIIGLIIFVIVRVIIAIVRKNKKNGKQKKQVKVAAPQAVAQQTAAPANTVSPAQNVNADNSTKANETSEENK